MAIVLVRGGMFVATLFIAACSSSSNYSQTASELASGISDLKTYSSALSQKQTQSQQDFYTVASAVNRSSMQMTPGCSTIELLNECYISDKLQLDKEAQIRHEVTESLSQALGKVFNTGQTTTSKILKALEIPDVCSEAIEYEITTQTFEASDAPAGVPERQPAKTEAEVLTALDNYAKGLAAITKESDSEDYKVAASKLSATIGTLASTIGVAAGGAGAAVGPIATAVVNIGTRANLYSLEAQRYETLKKVVLAACVPVNILAIAEGIILETKWNNTLRNNQNVIIALFVGQTTHPQVVTAHRSNLLQAAANLRALGPNPGPTAQKVAQTHNKLVVAVMSGEGQTEALLAAVGEFVDEAQALKDAIKASRGAAPDASSG